MARRVVQECDLTKLEYDPELTVTLIIKRGGKKAGRTYELSPEAAAKLEQQLVGKEKLDPNWTFGISTSAARAVTGEREIKTLGDLDSDDAFVREMKLRREEGEEKSATEEDQTFTPAVNNGCSHMNKGTIQTSLKGRKRFVYRVCRECRSRIPEPVKADREAYLNATPPEDSRMDYKQ